jgi:hydrogenase maturation protease
MKTIVLGIGNPILRDDGVGIHVAQQLKQHVTDPSVTVDEAFTGGMNLLDILLGYDKAILIDTVTRADARNGDVLRFSLGDSPEPCHSCNPHDVSLQEALHLAERLGEKHIPRDIVVIGIVVKKMSVQFGEQLSKSIAAAVPKAVAMTLHELKKTKQWRKNTLT